MSIALLGKMAVVVASSGCPLWEVTQGALRRREVSYLPSMVANSIGCSWCDGVVDQAKHELELASKDPTTMVGDFFGWVSRVHTQKGFIDLDAQNVTVQLLARNISCIRD